MQSIRVKGVKVPAEYIILRKRNNNNSFDLSCKDSSKNDIFAANRIEEGQFLWRYWWTGPDLPHGTFRSARAWGPSRLKVNFLRDALTSVKNLEFCQNLEQNNQIFMRKSDSTKDSAHCGESFEKAFISSIQV